MRSNKGRADRRGTAGAYVLAPIVGLARPIRRTANASATRLIDDVLPVAETVAIVQVATIFGKYFAARERPNAYFATGPLDPKADNFSSFWSGHSVLGFAITSAAGTVCHERRYWTEPYVWTAGIALSLSVEYLRMAADQHYLSDVVTGGLIGLGAGLLVLRLMDRSAGIILMPNGVSVGRVRSSMRSAGGSWRLNLMVQHLRKPHSSTPRSPRCRTPAARRAGAARAGGCGCRSRTSPERFDSDVTGMKKHVGVLEHAGFRRDQRRSGVCSMHAALPAPARRSHGVDRLPSPAVERALRPASDQVIEELKVERRRESNSMKRTNDRGTEIRARGRHHAHLQRLGAPRAPGVDQAGAHAPDGGVPKSSGLTPLPGVDRRPHRRHQCFVFQHASGPMAFFGRYLEAFMPHSRLVWT